MLGFNQSQMAKELGISKQSYYAKESGNVHFTDDEKAKFKGLVVAIFPNITIDDIFFARFTKKY
ncbi:hypothetical protein FC07_GL000953 [Loigolactobacillus bifermentans DSM 20003]|uniref:HTH cro/C1-type domain-containing protein n=2 Tax=Loigolactobacillus bifermentans TaxID=1607 RepID=A0A0R1H9W9_9LACO|nr:hypothetical protein FC07_GL000953 [Loigolactobacillus bifermentans DSM 20003]QGG61801.1 transcriptional regulator [Loigolactobacillus bifermentans]